jgi:hypothetical protein
MADDDRDDKDDRDDGEEQPSDAEKEQGRETEEEGAEEERVEADFTSGDRQRAPFDPDKEGVAPPTGTPKPA